MIINKVCEIIKFKIFKRLWRKKNKNNFTFPVNVFDTTKVNVGRMSYGKLDVKMWGNEKEKLEIGNYVSISSDVKFILGGNHNINTFSTYPFKVMVLGDKTEASSKGPIIVEDDVWIGMSSTILSGVTIGKGSIIAANSIITKDVPRYSIVAGNPAKVIKYRFEDELRTQMNKVEFSKINYKFIEANIDKLYLPLDKESLNELIKELDNK